MAEDQQNKSEYTAESISVLEGLDPVRKRPGMYIGSTGKDGLHHLVWEVVDNAIDEAMAGHCTEIEVALLEGGRVRVSDNGRGIPVEVHKQTKVSALETVLTILHAGGKFGGGGYKVSGGLHGVGVSVVNALSSHLTAEVKRDGKIYVQEYKIGKPQYKVKQMKDEKKAYSPKRFKTGTTIVFDPDMSIFSEDAKLSWTKILERLRQQAYLTKGIRIIATDEVTNRKYGFYFETGIRAFIAYLNRSREKRDNGIFYVEQEKEGINVETAFQYTDDLQPLEYCFANNIHTPEGGMHLTGFRTALTRTINDYAKKNNLIKDAKDALSGDDVREGLTVVISVKVPDPQFEGQTKAKLGNPEVRTIVDSVISESLLDFLDRFPNEARQIVNKCLLANKARLAAKAARDTIIRKGALEGMTLPGKLADCSSRDASACELYIVEGDSAGGSAKQGRDRKFQAILPLKGKILNVEKARLDRILSSQEIKALIIAMGAGVGDYFDIEKMRYHRIIIMTDADVDGNHITTLLLTLYYRHFPEVINKGYLYIAQPPLFRVQSGKKVEYAYTEVDKEEIVAEMQKGKKGAQITEGEEIDGDEKMVGINIQRYKGLGEMNPSQLWETTMNPENRVMKKVMVEDAEEANNVFSILMGDDVKPRKLFIQTHAKNAKNLDI